MLLRKQGRVLAVILLLVASAAGATIPLDWAALPPLPNPDGVAGIFAGFHNNAVIAAGGANFSEPVWESPKVFHDDIYVLIGREGKDCRWIHGGKLPRPVAYGASASTSRGVVCLGGNDADECFRDTFLMQWQEQEQSVVMQPLPPLPAPCTNSTAAVIRDRVYVAGGCTGLELETAQRNFWMLDLSLFGTDGFRWEELPPWPGPSRALAVVAAQHNGVADCVYVMSGRRVNGEGVTEFLRDVYEYMPGRAEPWHYRTDTPRCIMAGTGIALGQSHIFVLSGADETLFYQTDLLKDAHPGFPKEAFAYHTITDTWTAAGTTPANQVTTPAVRWGQDTVRDPVLMISGEIRPRVRTPQVWAVRSVPGASRFGTLDFVMLGIYLAAMVLLGVFFSFRNKNTDDFFRGGQRVPWFVAGLSIFATMLSSITFMAIPAKSYATNWIFFLFNMTAVASAPLVIYLFLPFFRKVNAVSAYFVKPEERCVLESVAPDGSISDHFDGRMLNPGHAIEAAWFIMEEGRIRKDKALVEEGCRMLDWMWQRGWDQEYGGLYYFRDLYNRPVQEYWHDMKFWCPHNEALIATLLAWRLTGEESYAEKHLQLLDWCLEHFADPEHGEWYGYLHRDGTVSVPLKGNLWKSFFHHPRCLWKCWNLCRENISV